MVTSEVDRRQHIRVQHRRSVAGRPSKGPTKCPKCDEIFPSGKAMIEHRRSVHPSVPYIKKSRAKGGQPRLRKCIRCEETFSSREELRNHQSLAHKMLWTKHECPICYRTVIGKERFQGHLDAHENNTLREVDLFYCEVCGQHFYKQISLTNHMTREHNDQFTCFICKADHPSGKLLRDHLVSHEKPEKFFHCMTCFRGFTSQQFYDIHIKIAHHDKRRHTCDHDQCNESLETMEELNEHLKRHAEEAREKGDVEWGEVHTCKTCGKGFLKQYNFTMHGLTHTPHNEGQPGYTCPVGDCGQVVRYVGTLLTHYNREHGLGLMPCKCHVCGKAFSSVVWYKTHVRQCEGGDRTSSAEKFLCKLCGAEFGSKKELVDHRVEDHMYKRRGRRKGDWILCPEPDCGERRTPYQMNIHLARVHGKGEKLPCEQCGKLFLDLGHLKEHLFTHEPPRHKCDICGRGFKKPNLVKSHKAAVHTEHRQKSYTCHLCGMSYFTRQGLKYHTWGTHTKDNELRHRCSKCGKGYGRRLLMTMHMKNCTGRREGEEGEDRKPAVVKGSKSGDGRGRKRRKMDDEEEEEMSDRSTSSEDEVEGTGTENKVAVEECAPLYPHQLPQGPPPTIPSTAHLHFQQWIHSTAAASAMHPPPFSTDPTLYLFHPVTQEEVQH